MKLSRMFSNDDYKGTRGYLNTQKKYELARTILYFGISAALFVAGWITTNDRINLLTVVAILGCLPASKSFVETIMYFRYQGLSMQDALEIEKYTHNLDCLYDLVFTAYEKNYEVKHLTVRGNTICGYTDREDFDEKDFCKHIDSRLKADSFSNTTVKIFKDLPKYVQRLEQLEALPCDGHNTQGIMSTLKSVSL